MKTLRFLVMTVLMVWSFMAYAQEDQASVRNGFDFTIVRQLPVTSVKNQYGSGSCWSFSTLSVFESELLRMGRDTFDLSEMFCVRHAYEEQVQMYAGKNESYQIHPGGIFHDVTNILKKYGMVPEQAYSGIIPGVDMFNTIAMETEPRDDPGSAIVDAKLRFSPGLQVNADGIPDSYLGEIPDRFEYKGVQYTPFSFASMLGINPDDYVELTSFTHHPFYSKFIIEVPDNWAMAEVYNLPLDEMMQVIKSSVMNGYTVAWGGDVTERGFCWKNGIAVVPDIFSNTMPGMDDLKWKKIDDISRQDLVYRLDRPVPEKEITQEVRQTAFENHQTTDDHGMQITGIAKDQYGKNYYIVKNSWGTENNPYGGYIYISEAYVAYKTTILMVNRNAIPEDIRRKMGL